MLGNVAISLSDDITCLSKRKRQNSGFPAEIPSFVPSLNTTVHCSGGGVSNCQSSYGTLEFCTSVGFLSLCNLTEQ